MRNFGIITNFILTQNTQGSRLPLAGQNGPRGFLSFLHGLITLSRLSKPTMNEKRTNWRGYNMQYYKTQKANYSTHASNIRPSGGAINKKEVA